LLRALRLTIQLNDRESTTESNASADAEHILALNNDAAEVLYLSPLDDSAASLAESLRDLCVVCESLLSANHVTSQGWYGLGKVSTREFERHEATRSLARASHIDAATKLPTALHSIVQSAITPLTLRRDVLIIFTDLIRLLERLRFIEKFLNLDRALKQTLPVFALVYQESRHLAHFMHTRARCNEGIGEAAFDTLDATNYAITMELRRVFGHELVGLSALRQASPIYAKVESAHGLLRGCFQQSIIALGKLFDPALDERQLFTTYTTKLEEAINLRRDLWALLQLLQRAAKEGEEQCSTISLLEQLNGFRDHSMRYLMYKDWETCERFIEEVTAARGAVELAPVLHSLITYLETLFNQVNMRNVLAEHPFEYA
jgi:hypothetical protein